MERISNQKKHSFFIRILLPTILTIGLFITSLFLVFIPQFENAVMDRKREMIRELTNSAWSILEKGYKTELHGQVTRAEAQEIAKTQIESLRYGEELKDYFWITDFYPNMIMHPYRIDLNNKDLTNVKDSHGKTLFIEMVKTAKANGGGFVDYMWQWKDDSTRIVPKLSYVKMFEPWQWVIGTGIYIEDVRKEIAALEKQILNISIGITALISLLLSFITYQNFKTEKHRLRAEADLHESREKFRSIVEASTEGLIMILEDKQIYFNKTICEMLGYSEEEVNFVNLEKIFVNPPKLSIFNFRSVQLQTDFSPQSEQVETVLKKKDDSIISVLLIASPISFLKNKGVVFSLKDISTTKKITDELHKHEEKYQALANKLSIGMFRAVADKKGRLVELNNAMMSLLGINQGTNVSELLLIDFFENLSDGEKVFNDIHQFGLVENKIVSFNKLNGQKIIVSISAIISEDEENKILFFDGMLEDFSVQTRTEEEKNDLINELQHSVSMLNRPIDKFIKTVPVCNLNCPISEVIEIMARENSESILLTIDSGKEVGIVTLTDLKNRILTKETNLKLPAYNFMSSPLISVPHSSSLYDALSKLEERNVRHLLVRNDESSIVGIINSGDLQKAFHITYLFFLRNIQNAESVNKIKSAHIQAMYMVKGLIKENRSAAEITRMTTIIADTVMKRLIELAILEFGEPPVPFAFIALGSEGREEQTLSTDQDNALLFEETETQKVESLQPYFQKLAEKVSGDLNDIGYEFCKGNVMAKNPCWCQPLSVWKNYFTEWITKSEPQDLLELKIFFDFRHIYGNEDLVNQLQKHVSYVTSCSSLFFVYMAESTLQVHIPEGAQKLKTVFDIKLLMLPIVDLARLYSLKNQIKTTNTIKRMELLYQNNIISKTRYLNLLQIYNFLMRLRFTHQACQLSEHVTPDNFIDPHTLSDIDSAIIKRATALIEEWQNKARMDFKGTSVRL